MLPERTVVRNNWDVLGKARGDCPAKRAVQIVFYSCEDSGRNSLVVDPTREVRGFSFSPIFDTRKTILFLARAPSRAFVNQVLGLWKCWCIKLFKSEGKYVPGGWRPHNVHLKGDLWGSQPSRGRSRATRSALGSVRLPQSCDLTVCGLVWLLHLISEIYFFIEKFFLLRNNWHAVLHSFQVYNIMIQYLYILISEIMFVENKAHILSSAISKV